MLKNSLNCQLKQSAEETSEHIPSNIKALNLTLKKKIRSEVPRQPPPP
jgi:hypothetical protein